MFPLIQTVLRRDYHTWRVGGLSKWIRRRLIRTLKGTLIGVPPLITLLEHYLLSPPTLPITLKPKP